MQVELLIDAVQTARGQLTLSIPELDSEQTFQTHFNPGKTKSNFTILINTVLEMTPVSLLCVISITRPRSCFIFFFIQASQVKLWWPNGHGEQPYYRLTIRGFQDEFLIFSTESKVRVCCLSAHAVSSFFIYGF